MGFHFPVGMLLCFSDVALSPILLRGIRLSLGSVNGEIITDLAPAPFQKFFGIVAMEHLWDSYIMDEAL